MEIKLSIIVPVYNVEQYLQQCISSILNQTLNEIEVILVNDGSTDGSGKICEKYSVIDTRVSVLCQNNKGPMEARQLGLGNAKGRYVTFVDADDFIEEKSYEMALFDMEKDIDIISFGIIRYFTESYKRYDEHKYKPGIYSKERIKECIIPTMIWDSERASFGLDPSLCNKVIKRDLLVKAYDRVKNKGFHYGEDVAILYPLILNVDKMSLHNNYYYNHRQRFGIQKSLYIKDESYFDKLYTLYLHLKDVFNENNILLEQIEHFYVDSVQLKYRKRIDDKFQVLFPYDKVDKGESIILYGAGKIGRVYVRQLKQINYCNVKLWVDGNYEKLSREDIKSPEEICNIEFDKIVIAIEDKHNKDIVKNQLIKQGISEEKIV